MELLCIGLSHLTAPVAVRERLALPQEGIVDILQRVGTAGEAMIVSTCNRVEFYAAFPSPETARGVLREHMGKVGGEEALLHLYEHVGDAALVHLFRVAASLDSMVLGEAQILGQVKDAFELARRAGSARGELARACSAAFMSAKRVRTETAIGRAATSMASAAVELAGKVFGGLERKRVLLVGAGEMAELAAKHLRSAGASELMVVNRTFERADELAKKVEGTAHRFDALNTLLVAADVVVCSTASPKPIFTRDSVGAVLKARKYRPLFMVDLAVPRDVAPDVNELDGVYAYDVDDIQKVVSENASARLEAASHAERIIAEEIARFVRSRSIRDGVPIVAQLRARAEQIARAEAERTVGNWGEPLTEKQRRSIEAMALAITNKLLHQPTIKLRSVGTEEAGSPLIDAAAELFGLESDSRKETAEDIPVDKPLAARGGSR